MSYWIGSKARMGKQLRSVFEKLHSDYDQLSFVDLFCGTGAAASIMSEVSRWNPLIVNDALLRACGMTCANVLTWEKHLRIAAATLEATPVPAENPFAMFAEAFAEGGSENRLFFSRENGAAIATVLHQASVWVELVRPEYVAKFGAEEFDAYVLAMYSMIADAIDRVSNTAGTYAAFLKKLKPAALNPFKLDLTPIMTQKRARSMDDFYVFNQHIETATVEMDAPLWSAFEDVIYRTRPDMKFAVYIDPPYVDRRYDRIYHISESVMYRDPSMYYQTSGKSGRPVRSFTEKSEWTTKGKALRLYKALIDRLNGFPTAAIVTSYSNQGILDINDMVALLETSDYTVSIETVPMNQYRSHKNVVQKDPLFEYILVARHNRYR